MTLVKPQRSRIETARRRNMRQLLQRATRVVSGHVLEGLHARGYSRLRSTHTTLLANLPLAGGTISVAAERAGITKQAMGRLAAELAELGYLRTSSDPADARARRLELTEAGTALMLDSFEVMREVEQRYAKKIGAAGLRSLLDGLRAFNEAFGGLVS